MSRTIRHPLFARGYTRLSEAAEVKGGAAHRDRLLAGLEGRVIEVGAGNGLNFQHYPDSVTEVVAVEPEPYLRSVAERAAARAPVPIRVVEGTADQLPGGAGEFDAAVASLVLCSVPEQDGALTELFRVIRPGGELRFYEHVLAENPRWAQLQHRAAPLWSCFGGGCHPDRDTGGAIRRAGFDIQEVDSFLFAPAWIQKLTAQHILGRALRPST